MTLFEKYLRRAEQAFARRAADESLRAMNRALDGIYVNRVPQDEQRVFRMLVEAGTPRHARTEQWRRELGR